MTTAKQAQRTPGPWKVRVNSGRYGPTNGMGQIHNGDATNPIGNVALANAQFIVRACNSHDDLLAALKKARGALEPLASDAESEGEGSVATDAYDAVCAAIAKAEAA